jgi:hypothetical protein
MKIIFVVIFILFLQIEFLNVYSSNLSKSPIEDELDEDEELVYGSTTDEKPSKKNHPSEDVKNRMDNVKSNMVNLGYDFSKAIKILYSNFSSIDVKVADIDYLYSKGIINENQAIMIWENLLNSKTERNLEWLGYSKLIRKDQGKDSTQGTKFPVIHNVVTMFNNPEVKFHSMFAYFGGIISYYLMKFFLKFPKLNMVIILFLLMLNIVNCFYFYKNKYYFSSFICLTSFISNIYYFYLSVIVLTEHREIDYSIFHTKHFKSRQHFLTKLSICTFIIFILNYLASISLRYFLNYMLIFYFLEKNRDMINNYCKLITPRNLQPFESFISLIFGGLILIYTHVFYYLNIYFSYDLNSFLVLNNCITFYYFIALEKFIYIQRNRLGGVFLDCEKISDTRDRLERFEELKKKSNLEKNFRTENFYEGNIIDIVLIIICCSFLFMGFYLNTYFYLLLAIFTLHTIHKNCLIFLSIKISRIISNFFLMIFLIAISNLDQVNFSYINEIIAVYDQKFLEALLLLFKLLFLVSLAICNYLSEDFVDMFNIYNYSSYKYLSRETKGITNNIEMNKRLNEIYTVRNVFIEIFEFDLNSSLDCVNMVLDSINTSGSNIDGFYIDYLLTKNTSNYHLAPLLLDYFLIYANFWILFDTFKHNNHSFFYITFMLHKIGLFAKLALLTFEYSKTHLQKNLIIILNVIFSMRMFTCPELEDSEKTVLIIFFLLNVLVYIRVYENKMLMNLFLITFNFIMLNNYSNSMPYVAISIGSIIAKIMIHYLKIKHFKIVIFLVCSLNSFFLFSSLNKIIIGELYKQLKSLSVGFLKVDFPGLIEQLCFGSGIGNYFENILLAKMKESLQAVKNFSF